jgi:hypothetical protein
MTSVINPADPGPVPGTAATADGHPVDPPAVTPHAVEQHAACAVPGGAQPTYRLPPPGRFAGFMTRLWERSPRWLAPAAILACFGGAAGYVLVSDPTDGTADAVPTCIVKLTTGFDCPGCGGTRAFYYLLQGNVPAAARHHLLFVFALPFLVYLYVGWAGQQVFRRRLPALRLPPAAVGIFLAGWFAFTILRNLPWAPFTWFYV